MVATGNMRLWRCIVLGGLFLATGCQRGPRACPEGMSFLKERSVDGQSLWCQSKEGAALRWTELWGPGDRRQICSYRNGRPEGPFTAWHKGGMTWIEGGYRNGEKEGHWTQWDKNGFKSAEGDYRGGRLIAGAPVGIVARCEAMTPK